MLAAFRNDMCNNPSPITAITAGGGDTSGARFRRRPVGVGVTCRSGRPSRDQGRLQPGLRL
eukprot:scaffold17350_cov52-Phaeocystis_antarctica.AAC.2